MTDQQFQVLLRHLQVIIAILGLMTGVLIALAFDVSLVDLSHPLCDSLMKGVSRRDFDMVLAWSVDRLGGSLTGLLELLTELHAKHVDL